MLDPELLERITTRRAELDELEEHLAKQLDAVRAERDELAVAERVLERVSEQLAEERSSARPIPGQVGGRAVMLIPHREPGTAVDVLGLVIAVAVLAASAHDNAAGIALLDKVAAGTDTVQKALVDQGFKTAVIDHGQKVGIDVEVVERNPAASGFVPQPKRWVVEQMNGIHDAAPQAGTGLRASARLRRVEGVLGHKRPDGPDAHRDLHPHLARRGTGRAGH